MSLLCATVTGATTAELVRARDAAAAADLVELRLDTVDVPDVQGAIAGRPRPVVVTCRPRWEGGAFDGPEEVRASLLSQALEHGAEFVDVEYASACRDALLQRARERVIVSHHDFEGVPRDLGVRLSAMRATGAAVVKLAVTARRLCDQLPLFELAEQEGASPQRHVCVAMGEAGIPSRVLAARLGNAWTYAGEAVAPGQLSLTRMAGEFAAGRRLASPRVFGVVGRPVSHSLSPTMHNAAMAHEGVDGCYLPLAAADFTDFLAFAEAVALEGASVTAPFKRDALEAALESEALAVRVGAANTLVRLENGWRAGNTDVAGFLAPLDGTTLRGARVAVLGAGGAARSVVVALQTRGAAVTVHARREARAAELAAEFGVAAGEWPPRPGTWDLLVNATPVGTWPDGDVSPIPGDLARGSVVYDLVYNPAETRLLREAAARGARTIEGLGMLVAQAAEQFTWWTGRPAPSGVMRAAAERALSDARGAAGDVVPAAHEEA